MSEHHNQSETADTPTDTEEQRKAQADAFGLNTDRLAEFAPIYEDMDGEVDPIRMFLREVINSKIEDGDLKLKTRDGYERTFRYWREHMADEGRHPACPNEEHVRRFIGVLRDEYEHTPGTIDERLFHLHRAYRFWQSDNSFPHPTDFDPFTGPLETESLGPEQPDKKQHRTTVDQIREILSDVTHIRDRAILLAQFKLGLRVSEVCNLRLEDVSLTHDDIKDHYSALGSHDALADLSDAIYIASKHERDGNKSAEPRVLPVDDELWQALIRYLLIRPDSGKPALFLTKKNHTKIAGGKAVNRAWKDAFHPEFAETDQYRPVTSHYGRHRFVTFWRNEGLGPEQLKYMRGDAASKDIDSRSALNRYIHTYYPDIKEVYLNKIYKLAPR